VSDFGSEFVPRRAWAADYVDSWHDGTVPGKPTSEQLRREPEKLRETAAKLMEHAETLIAKSAELEKRISRQNLENSALGKSDRRHTK
jgi:hypothetical protein